MAKRTHDLTPGLRELAEAVEKLRCGNDRLAAYLDGDESPVTRVANAPEMSLQDATEKARKHWDKLEGRRSSSHPPAAK